jgi:hypothetical protein
VKYINIFLMENSELLNVNHVMSLWPEVLANLLSIHVRALMTAWSSAILEKLVVVQLFKKCPPFMHNDSSLPYSQEPILVRIFCFT